MIDVENVSIKHSAMPWLVHNTDIVELGGQYSNLTATASIVAAAYVV